MRSGLLLATWSLLIAHCSLLTANCEVLNASQVMHSTFLLASFSLPRLMNAKSLALSNMIGVSGKEIVGGARRHDLDVARTLHIHFHSQVWHQDVSNSNCVGDPAHSPQRPYL